MVAVLEDLRRGSNRSQSRVGRGWMRTAARWLQRDLAAFAACVRPAPLLPRGLQTYRVELPGGEKRVHLRLEADGRGTLFVDVTQVLHLNPTAAEMAWWALEGTPMEVARARLRSRHGRPSVNRVLEDLTSVYELVERLCGRATGCPTCSLRELRRVSLFQTPIDAPFKADLALTYECNNDCPHCYNEPSRLSQGMLPVADWERILERLHAIGIPHLIFTGGEATLHPDLPEIIRAADAGGPICGLNTNGRRMAHASYAQELAAAGLNHVQVTLGSHRPEVHDAIMHARAFRQTVRGIENAIDAGLHTITNTTLMRMNVGEIEETIHFLHGLGIRTFAVNGMIYSGGGFDTGQALREPEMMVALDRIRESAEELGMRFLWYTPTEYCRLSPVELDVGAKRCNAGEYSLCIEPNGDVLPCQSYYVSAGNLLHDPWEEIWQGGLFRSFREREEDPAGHGLPEMCHDCPDLPLCGGGCRIEREAREGIRVADEGGCGGCSGCGSSSSAPGFVSVDTVGSTRRATGRFELPVVSIATPISREPRATG